MQSVAATNPIYRDKKNRVWELDFLRGVAVICMCFDHLMYDLAYCKGWFSNGKIANAFIDTLAEFARAYWKTGTVSVMGFRFWAHHIFVFLFLFMVGTSCALSRNNTKRGSLLAVVALAFTGVTFIIREMGIMRYGVVFGILHCIALSILCVSAVDIATSKVKWLNRYLPLALGVAILACGIYLRSWDTGKLFDGSFQTENMLKYILGGRAYGDDWFGLFPNVGSVLLGMYWGKSVYAVRRSILPRLDGKWNKPIRFVGRHALLFYIAHQVVIAGIVGAVCLCAGYRF